VERILFAKVEAWVIALVVLLSVVGGIAIAALALKTERGGTSFGAAGKIAHWLADAPDQAVDALRAKDTRIAVRTGDLDGKSGWIVHAPAANAVDGYLLLSRYDGDAGGAAIELVDLSDRSVRYRWQPDADILLSGARPDLPNTFPEMWNRHYFEAFHPLDMPDGGLVVKDHKSPLMRIDHCSNLVWRIDSTVFHHSTGRDAQGDLWVPTHVEPRREGYSPEMSEDGLGRISPDGQLLEEISLIRVFEENGLLANIFTTGTYMPDPLHLNDIEPVLSDGPYWRKGDLFLSLRRISSIALYRPSTGRIVWMKEGPWIGQHDVDIVDDHRISVFDNNSVDRGFGSRVLGHNEVMIYDFATDEVTSPWKAALAREGVDTLTEGLADFTDAGDLILEEENSGRLLIFAPDGTLLTEFVNRDAQGRIFTTSWSRYLDQAAGDAAVAALAKLPPC
jgi:Arylsulfotransferase (ASST)